MDKIDKIVIDKISKIIIGKIKKIENKVKYLNKY